jgi:outer membrane lipoprotein-sorting protein
MISSVLRAEDFIPNSFSVDYVKRYTSLTTKKESTERGLFQYLFPGYLRLESNIDTQTIVTINHETTWYYQGAMKGSKEPGQVEVHKSQSLPIIKAMDSIKKGLDTSTDFTKKNIGFDITLTAKPDFAEESNIKEIHFKARKNSIKTLKDVKSFITIEVDGKTTSYEFDDFKEKKYTKNHFIFLIPKNTKVLKK